MTRARFHIDTVPQLAELLVGITPSQIERLACRLKYQYSPRKRKKPDGSFRELFVPGDELKELQRKIKRHVLDLIPLPDCVYGGVPNKSIVMMAIVHAAQPVLFSMDIQKCFPSVGPARVRELYASLGFGDHIASLLTKLTTWKGELPQGTPTSTGIANIVLGPVDARLQRLCSQQGFKYTRWIDDLYISGSGRLVKFTRLFTRIVTTEGFTLNEEKIHIMPQGRRQLVTKLVVNQKPNVPRELRQEMRKELRRAIADGEVSNSTRGKLYWIRSINPDVGNALLRQLESQ